MPIFKVFNQMVMLITLKKLKNWRRSTERVSAISHILQFPDINIYNVSNRFCSSAQDDSYMNPTNPTIYPLLPEGFPGNGKPDLATSSQDAALTPPRICYVIIGSHASLRDRNSTQNQGRHHVGQYIR